MKVFVVSPTHRLPLLPRGYPWYSFLLEALSIPGPRCGRRDLVNEIFRTIGVYPNSITEKSKRVVKLLEFINKKLVEISSFIDQARISVVTRLYLYFTPSFVCSVPL